MGKKRFFAVRFEALGVSSWHNLHKISNFIRVIKIISSTMELATPAFECGRSRLTETRCRALIASSILAPPGVAPALPERQKEFD